MISLLFKGGGTVSSLNRVLTVVFPMVSFRFHLSPFSRGSGFFFFKFLKIFQNKSMRILFYIHYSSSVKHRYRTCGIFPLDQLRLIFTSNICHDYLYGVTFEFFRDFPTNFYQHIYPTTHRSDLSFEIRSKSRAYFSFHQTRSKIKKYIPAIIRVIWLDNRVFQQKIKNFRRSKSRSNVYLFYFLFFQCLHLLDKFV